MLCKIGWLVISTPPTPWKNLCLGNILLYINVVSFSFLHQCIQRIDFGSVPNVVEK